MSKIKQFNRANLNEVHIEIEKAMEKVAKKFGITVMVPPGSFNDNTFTVKSTFSTIAPAGAAPKQHFGRTGLVDVPANGTQFRDRNETYTVKAYVQSRPKFPIQAEDSKGRKIKCSIEYVNSHKI